MAGRPFTILEAWRIVMEDDAGRLSDLLKYIGKQAPAADIDALNDAFDLLEEVANDVRVLGEALGEIEAGSDPTNI